MRALIPVVAAALAFAFPLLFPSANEAEAGARCPVGYSCIPSGEDVSLVSPNPPSIGGPRYHAPRTGRRHYRRHRRIGHRGFRRSHRRSFRSGHHRSVGIGRTHRRIGRHHATVDHYGNHGYANRTKFCRDEIEYDHYGVATRHCVLVRNDLLSGGHYRRGWSRH